MSAYPHLLSPIEVDGLQLANRITMAPLYTGYADLKGQVTPLLLEHYQEMGASGAALIVVENAAVDPVGLGSPFNLRVDDDRYIEGLGRLAEAIKSRGARAALQINHAGRFAFADQAVAPSALPLGKKTPRALQEAEMPRVAAQFAAAAGRARQAGFDLVELHGGTGYLLSSFVSPRTNQRGDAYGGSLENRLRLPLEVIAAVQQAVGPGFPVGYRFLADEWLPDGLDLAESRQAAAGLAAADLAYLSVMGGTYESFFLPQRKEADREPGYMAHLAAGVKEAVQVPVIAAGRIQTPELAEELVAQGKADLIGLARVLLADPLWPQKAAQGRARDIIACQPTCNLCWNQVSKGKPIICSQWSKAKRQHFDPASVGEAETTTG